MGSNWRLTFEKSGDIGVVGSGHGNTCILDLVLTHEKAIA
jgi:hypothetical protein